MCVCVCQAVYIVGGSVGGGVFVLILCCVCYMCCRKKSDAGKVAPSITTSVVPGGIAVPTGAQVVIVQQPAA